jgi:hypothetical protein
MLIEILHIMHNLMNILKKFQYQIDEIQIDELQVDGQIHEDEQDII